VTEIAEQLILMPLQGLAGEVGLEVDRPVWAVYRYPVVTMRVAEGPEAELGMVQRDGPAPDDPEGAEDTRGLEAEQLGNAGGGEAGGHAREGE